MKLFRLLPLFLCIAILPGCMTPRVEAQVANFSNFSTNTLGSSVAIVGYPESVNESLEFARYRSIFESHLRDVGFIISNEDDAEYVAFVSYGIDGGVEESGIVSTPIYGQTGGGTTYTSGTVSSYSGGFGSYSGSSYTMPTYGIVGSSTSSYSYTVYSRQLAMDIVEASTIDGETPTKIFEGRVTSKGSCGVFAEVVDELVQAMFSKFPDGSGSMEVQGEFDC